MNIVIDSNILFSALIKNSKTRNIILHYDGLFLFPSYIFTELEHHKNELLEKSGMNPLDFDKLLNLILRKVILVPPQNLLSFKEEANAIVKDIDPDDVLFIACALAYENSILWSNDKRLKDQKEVKVMNTEEIMRFLK